MSTEGDTVADIESPEHHPQTVSRTQWEKLWPVIACGAGLFSDGYLNGVSIKSEGNRL